MSVTKQNRKTALFNRIFSIAGLSIGGAILIYLLVYGLLAYLTYRKSLSLR